MNPPLFFAILESMNPSDRKQRQNYLINPGFQWAMIRWTLFISLLSSGIFYISILVFFNHLADLGVNVKLPPDSLYFKFLMQESSRMNLIFALTTFTTIVVILIFGIRFSHKIAGPIYRFRTYLKSQDPASGARLPDLRFREDDFFQEMASDFNEFKSKIPGQRQE